MGSIIFRDLSSVLLLGCLGGLPWQGPPVSPAEIAATVYHGLGISLDTELPGPQGRPMPIVDHGVEPISELF